MPDVPWFDDAVAVKTLPRDADGFLYREIVAQGPFWKVLKAVQKPGQDVLPNCAVSFPGRGVRPFQYNGAELRELLAHPLRPREAK